jgi:hypothetical protein
VPIPILAGAGASARVGAMAATGGFEVAVVMAISSYPG